MNITLTNIELIPAINLLTDMELKAADSRHRSKFVSILTTAARNMTEAEMELIKRYGQVDGNGEPVIKSDGTFECKSLQDKAEFSEEKQKLMHESVILDFGMHEQNIKEIPRILQEYDGKLSGDAAAVYDTLLDQFEEKGLV